MTVIYYDSKLGSASFEVADKFWFLKLALQIDTENSATGPSRTPRGTHTKGWEPQLYRDELWINRTKLRRRMVEDEPAVVSPLDPTANPAGVLVHGGRSGCP
ncbi:hypothetical protein AVEN_87943-1 [Araneus ventricosus]|uniref:Uncharacterized protein n=1 Tax=Araneus ventricosus TaxID=182803 RepID=A0A4Y2MJL8_ARAVE|nr:hypothetical protein AVEN_87943-1 [Araneus ventricosus]